MNGGLIGRALGGARQDIGKWAARLCGALTLFVSPMTAYGDHLTEYSYTVLRDGEPIGTHQVSVSPDGPDLMVEARTDLEVTFGPLTLYSMEHLRHELWRDGELEQMTAHTNKNGAVYDIAITREPQGYTRVVNGRTDRFEPSIRLLALWHDDLFKYNAFLSPMEDKTYQISVDFIGADKIDLLDRSVEAFFYRMSGDTNRELWYDADGHIMKVRLLDHSSAIEYVLNGINGANPEFTYSHRAKPRPHGPIARLAARK